MSIEDDMRENGFSNEQDYLDYLFDKATTEWDKQQERDRKADEWENYLESLSDDDIEDIKREKEEKRRKLLHIKQIEEEKKYQLNIWREENPEESKIWDNVPDWHYYTDIIKSEFDRWKPWVDERNAYQKWKQENSDDWEDLKKNIEKETVDYWINLDNSSSIDNLWADFVLWREEHIEEWNSHKEKFNEINGNDKIYELHAWKVLVFEGKEEFVFKLWLVDHMHEWENWKKGKNKYQYHYLTKWVEDHSEIWGVWKNNNLHLWEKWEKEFLDFWKELVEKSPLELYRKYVKDFHRNAYLINSDERERDVVPTDLWVRWVHKNKNLYEKKLDKDISNGIYRDLFGTIIRDRRNRIQVEDEDHILIWERCKAESEVLHWILELCNKKGVLSWIEENQEEYDKWLDLFLWYEDRDNSMRRGRRRTIEGYEKWIENINKGGDVNSTLFHLWHETNKETWEVWKINYFDEWKNKIHNLEMWKIWLEDHYGTWAIWANEKLNSWKSWINERLDDELYYAWKEDHIGEKGDYKKWLERNADDWSIWKNELEERIYKKKWNQNLY